MEAIRVKTWVLGESSSMAVKHYEIRGTIQKFAEEEGLVYLMQYNETHPSEPKTSCFVAVESEGGKMEVYEVRDETKRVVETRLVAAPGWSGK